MSRGSVTRERTTRNHVTGVAAAALACLLLAGDWLWRVDTFIYDQLLFGRARPAPDDVLIVAIDDHSLEQLGRWPWPRRTHAELVDVLTAAGARAIVFDVAFAEPGPRDDDDRLARAVRRSGKVVLPVMLERNADGSPVEALPIPALSAAAALGHVDVEADPDGTTRALYLRAGIGDARWPALPLAALMLEGDARPAVRNSPAKTPPARSLAWVRNGRVLIPFAAGLGHPRTASYVDVLRGRLPSERIADATVFIGATAIGLGNALRTPGSAGEPVAGVELMASAFDSLREARTITYLGLGPTSVLTAALVIGLFAVPLRRRALGLLVGIVAPICLSWGLLQLAGVWFTPAAAGLAFLGGQWSLRWTRRGMGNQPQQARQRAAIALGSVQEAVLTIDADERIEYLNPIAEQWSGVNASDAQGQVVSSVLQMLDAEMRPLTYAALAHVGRLGGFAVGRNGVRREVRGAVVESFDATGASQGLVIALASGDRTRGDHGLHDPLTGLPARALVREHLGRVLSEARATGRQGAVLIMDVQRLRDVNVALGREAGDRVLTEVATRLRRATSGRGVAGRIGGGEFVVIYDDVRLDEDESTLGSHILEAFSEPVVTNARVSFRVGVSLFPVDDDDADTLLQRADTAMRAEDASGVRGVRVYKRQMSQTSRDRVILTRALELAIEHHRLSLAYQPIVDLMTGRLIAVEALARWRDDDLGSVPPSTFVPLAEETGLIGALGAWTVEEACRQAGRWDAAGLKPFGVSVNVSPRQFLQPSFSASIRQTVAHTGLPPSRLMLEVTESAMQDVDQAVSILEDVRRSGVTVALDDFGVGYSSLSHLRQLPVDVVKIDRSFVSGIDVEGPDRTICLAVLALAGSLQRRVVAEGVETGAQADFLRSKGCREVQGFYTGRPVDPAQIRAFAQAGTMFVSDQPALPFM